MTVRGVILCSGDSRRLGEPKALLRFGAETMVERVLRIFREGGVADNVVVVGGQHAEVIRESLGDDVTCVENPDPSPGPISSVCRGIGAVLGGGCTGVLVHPVDIPGVRSDDVRALLDAFEAHAAAGAVIPSIALRRGHPVLLRAGLAEKVLAAGTSLTLREHLADAETIIKYVVRENPLLREDVDTREDYERLRSLI